jgi:hypothetical protein
MDFRESLTLAMLQSGLNTCASTKTKTFSMCEQRCVIRFLLQSGFLPKDIADRRNIVDWEDAIKKQLGFFKVDSRRLSRKL